MIGEEQTGGGRNEVVGKIIIGIQVLHETVNGVDWS